MNSGGENRLFHSVVKKDQESWFSYEPFILLSTYKVFQKRFIDAYSHYEYLVERYREVGKRAIHPISEEYLDKNPEVAEENVALLKNAIELWRSAAQTTDAIAPILFHYSWHCFNSFFVYTFFRWEPQHSQSHGIRIFNLNDNVGEIKIQFLKDGLFQRLVDAWTCMGASLAFSAYLPIFEEGKVEFQSNQIYVLQESNCLNLAQLLNFDPVKDYENVFWNTFGREKLLQNPSFSNSMSVPTRILKNYLILFAASSIARYRPILWSSILSGETEDKTAFALAYRNALLMYAHFDINSLSFLHQFSLLINDLMNGKFELKKLPWLPKKS
jgi:hypothetical protein